MKNLFLLLVLLTTQIFVFGQTKTDVQKDKLFGKVKSTYTYEVNYKNHSDTTFFARNLYSENGMKLKYLNYYQYSRTDSIVNTYDKQNRIKTKIEYESIPSLSSNAIEKRIDTTYYEYNTKCDDYTVLKNPRGTYQINYVFDENCRIISETEIGRGRTNLTEKYYDPKGRVVKQTFTYNGDKPDKLETYKYDDKNNTLTYLEYSPRYDVYREKTITQFNKNNKVIQKTFFNTPITGGSITFTTGSKNEPDQIHLIKKYQFDNDDKLLIETHLDGKNNELLKVEVFYDEKGELREQKFYKASKLEYREEYKYENGKRVEEKQFLPSRKKPEYIKTRKYNANNQLVEYILLQDKNKFSNEYVYDNLDNEIEKKELKNGKIISIKFTKIEYYP